MSDAQLSSALDSIGPSDGPERRTVGPGEFSSDHVGLEEAASELSETRAPRADVIERSWGDPDKNYLERAPDSVELGPEEAADALKGARDWENQVAQGAADIELAGKVDAFRAGEQPQQQPDQFQPQAEAAPVEPTALDRLLEPLPPDRRAAFVQDYQAAVAQAQNQASAAYQAAAQQYQATAQQYQSAVENSIFAIEAMALSPFPDLASTPRDQIQSVLGHIARTNPNRFQQIQNHVAAVKQIASSQIQQAQALVQHQAQHQQAERQRHQDAFNQMAAVHDAAARPKSNWRP
jgi:hypothetical protein